MPYCQKCKTEFEKGIKTCSACGSALVESPDNEPEETDDREAFLINAADEMEASIFISKLSALGIPVMKKYVELGLPVFMGNSRLGIDLYVPSRLLGEAKNILNDEALSDEDINFDDMLNEYGFDDIDNLDFEESEQDKVTEAPEDRVETQKELKQIPKGSLQENADNEHNTINKGRSSKNKTLRIIAIVTLIVLVFTTIYSGFQMFGSLLWSR